MTTKNYHKLVRDRIPEIIRKRGGVPVVRTADEREYAEKLREKLQEEVAELLAAEDDASRKEELADVLEVVRAIARHHGYDMDDIEVKRIFKSEERGGFRARLVLESTT